MNTPVPPTSPALTYADALRGMVAQFDTDKIAAQAVWDVFETRHKAYRLALGFTLSETKALCEFGRWRSAVGLEWDMIGDKLGRTVWAHNGVLTLGVEGRSFLLCARPAIVKPKPLTGTNSGLAVVCISDPLCNAYIQRNQPTEINFALLTEEWHEKVVQALKTGLYLGEIAQCGADGTECPYEELGGECNGR